MIIDLEVLYLEVYLKYLKIYLIVKIYKIEYLSNI